MQNLATTKPTTLAEQLRESNGFFIHYFHGPHIEEDDEIPDFHIDMANQMLTSPLPYFACAVPREHAKTTIAKLMIVKALLFFPYYFPVYFSDTHKLACKALRDVWDYLRSEEFYELTGEHITVDIERPSEGEYSFRMRWFPEGRPVTERHYKDVSILAKGRGNQFRGTNEKHRRPDFAVLDDVESKEVVESESQFKDYAEWLYGPVMKGMSKRFHRVIQIGNLVGSRSMLLLHMKDSDWSSRRYGAIRSTGEPLWPGLWTKQALKKDFDKYARVGLTGVWFGEMMNLPFNPDSSLVDLGTLTYAQIPDPADPRILASFINIDPAISKRSHADTCAIVVTIMLETGQFQHVEVVADKGFKYDRIYEEATRLADKWHSNLIFVENDAFQAVLLDVFTNMATTEGRDFRFIGVPTQNIAKIARLRAWATWLSNGELLLSYGESMIVNQLGAYDRTKGDDNDDDLIDACAQLPTVLNIAHDAILQSRVSGVMETPSGDTIIQGTLV